MQDLRNTPELIALAVNLTTNARNAEVMCEGDRFDKIIRRAFQVRGGRKGRSGWRWGISALTQLPQKEMRMSKRKQLCGAEEQ